MLILFDIDGTLVRLGSAGRRSMEAAFERVYGIPDGFANVDFRGSLDPSLLDQARRTHGIPQDPVAEARFLAHYLEVLESTLDPAHRADQHLCPGVEPTLQRLSSGHVLGLVTGNWREGARRKLGAFGLWERFAVGGFGEDGTERVDLVRMALWRAQAQQFDVQRVAVVGDTPADVESARRAGARSVAVCTGWNTEEDLRNADPDLLLPDLESGLPDLLALLEA
ncbi:MAG: HAD family hydrolase [Deltaproteobacteria bacterium]|nr:HAD family hydrolase [Deltaproteobacteria bacterium]